MFRTLTGRLEEVGRYFSFLAELLSCAVRRPFRFHLYLAQIDLLGVNSIPIIMLSGLAIGMIFALQMVALMIPFKAEIGAGAAVALALAQELAPIITTLMLIAKSGSAMAAELGTMRVTEQIDALESMSVNPIHYLVLPRVIASIIVFPALTLLANIVGVFGSYFVSTRLYEIDAASYVSYMFDVLSPKDINMGLIKSAIMGFMVASICCYSGLHAEQGAKGVGDSATKAVVASSITILLADYIMTSIIKAVW